MFKIRSFTIIFSLAVSVTMFCSSGIAMTYTVKSGDTLSEIAARFCGNPMRYPEIFEANSDRIRYPEFISPGWTLTIPNTCSQKTSSSLTTHRGPIMLVTGNNYEPFTDEKLLNSGMITDIVKNVFKEMGVFPDIEFKTWKYGYESAKNLIYEATFPWLKNEERKSDFYFSDPLYKFDIWLFVKKGASIKFEKAEDLTGLTVCRPQGWYTHDIKPLMDKDIITVKRPEDIGPCFQMLKDGEVDVVPVNWFTGWSSIKKEFNSYDGFQVLDKPISNDTLHLIISKINPKAKMLLSQFNNALNKLKKNKVLNQIIERHIKIFNYQYNIPETKLKIQLVTGNNYEPFTDEKLYKGGMVTEIVRKAFQHFHDAYKKIGIDTELEIDFKPWGEGFKAAQEVSYDATFPWLINKSRQKLFNYSKSLYDILIKCYVRKDESIEYRELEDFQGLTFCRPQGWYMHDIQELIDRNLIKLETPEDIGPCFRMLKEKKVDVVPVNQFTAAAAITEEFKHEGAGFKPEDRFCYLEKPLSEDSIHLIVSKKHPLGEELLQKFDEALGMMKESGVLNDIQSTHLKIFKKQYPIIDKIGPCSSSSPPPSEPVSANQLRLVTGNNYEPFTDEDLPEDGMITEVMEESLRLMDKTYDIDFKPWQEGIDATEDTEYDASFPWLWNEDRAKKFLYSDPLYDIVVWCFVKKNANIQYRTEKDFSGKTFCRPQGWYMHDILALLNQGADISIEHPEDIGPCFQKLKKGEVDVVPANKFVGWSAINKEFKSNRDFCVLDKELSVDALHIIVSKDHPNGSDLIKQFNQAIARLKENGQLGAIIQKHLSIYSVLNNIPEDGTCH